MICLRTFALLVLAGLIAIPAGQSFGQASPPVAGDSEAYELVVASLQAQLKNLPTIASSCEAGVSAATLNLADAIDRAETAMSAREAASSASMASSRRSSA